MASTGAAIFGRYGAASTFDTNRNMAISTSASDLPISSSVHASSAGSAVAGKRRPALDASSQPRDPILRSAVMRSGWPASALTLSSSLIATGDEMMESVRTRDARSAANAMPSVPADDSPQ